MGGSEEMEVVRGGKGERVGRGREGLWRRGELDS